MELLCLPTSEEAALFQVIGVRETEVVEIRGKAPPTTLRTASQSTAGATRRRRRGVWSMTRKEKYSALGQVVRSAAVIFGRASHTFIHYRML